MRYVLLSLSLLFTIVAFAQDCESLVQANYDKMSGKTTNSTIKSLNLGGKYTLDISNNPVDSTVTIFFKAGDYTCVDENNKMVLLFTDTTRASMFGNNRYNCDGITLFILRREKYFDKKLFNSLINNSIETIRIWDRLSFSDLEFTKEQADTFKKALACLSKGLLY